MKVRDIIKTVLFTRRCKLCGQVVEVDAEFCEDCLDPPRIKGKLCKHCGCSTEECSCKQRKNEYKRVIAPFYYEDSLVRSVNSYKDNDMIFIADYLSQEMADCIREHYKDIKFDFITFVPLGELKERYRGFNQSELLAQKISERIGIDVNEVLYKCRNTGTLHKNKNKVKRSAAVFGAFDVFEDCKKDLEGKIILLVDDVKTTGSTLNECAKMLKIFGAKEVYAVTASIKKQDKKP